MLKATVRLSMVATLLAVAAPRAQKTDPGFAMAYWGEAMSHNHPLWAQQETDAARKILEKMHRHAMTNLEAGL